ncbi:hypothetical protein SAMN04488543_0416 [Friedmanniella luteola]|uniref:Uncharacterized protein n=1 Tax=Friedmanniella luteola TaxID=546871 RepID=A0A1H1LST4_9ACTN|nr:hypothetical protein [Friedmanniella luteola]SDR77402.1 hypothetical protein SAMN04488543_0416 [Friedmanniella luteola]
MTWALVLVVAATAAFTALVVRRTPRRVAPGRPDLRSLLDAGAAVLGVLALAVAVTVVITDRPDQGAKLAVLGLLSYLVYVGAAAVITRGR